MAEVKSITLNRMKMITWRWLKMNERTVEFAVEGTAGTPEVLQPVGVDTLADVSAAGAWRRAAEPPAVRGRSRQRESAPSARGVRNGCCKGIPPSVHTKQYRDARRARRLCSIIHHGPLSVSIRARRPRLWWLAGLSGVRRPLKRGRPPCVSWGAPLFVCGDQRCW